MKTADAGDFEFYDSGKQIPAAGGTISVVRIPRGITRKRKLLAALAAALQFPDYFGHNWDALAECLGDLSWLENAKTVCLVHGDLPCADNRETLDVYLDVLRNRLKEKQKDGVALRVFFPAAFAAALKAK
jgi:hypothetical protein